MTDNKNDLIFSTFELIIAGLPSTLFDYLKAIPKHVDRVLDKTKEYEPDDLLEQAEYECLLYDSAFMLSYFYLEYAMKEFFKEQKKKAKIPIGLNDLNGDLLERVKKYAKLCNLNFDFSSQLWSEVNNYSRIRNCTAHNYGEIDVRSDDGKKLMKYAESKGIVLDGELALNGQFCDEAIKNIDALLKEFYKAYKKQIVIP